MIPRRDYARTPTSRHDYARNRRWARPELDARQASFGEFVLLSLLLHMLGILLFGSTSGSGTPGGRTVWGTLAVTLPFQPPAPGIGLRLDRGGDLAIPGAPVRRRPETATETVPRVSPKAKNIVDKPVAPAVPKSEPAPEAERRPEPAIATPLAPAPAMERIAPPKVERELAAPVELKPSEVPLAPVQTLPPIAPPTVVRELAPPVELRANDVPLVPTQTLERIAPPRLERELAAPVELRPSEVPLVPTQTLERIAPQAAEPHIAAPVELKQSEVPLVPTQTLERIAPAPQVRKLAAPPAELAPAPMPPAPRAVPREVFTAPAPTGRSRTAPPDVVDDPFSSPPGASAPAHDAPRIDLDAMRQRAREIAKEGTGQRAILPLPLPAKPAQKSREELAIEKAWKPDCKTAYSGMGLLAMIPLMMNAIGEGTCSWQR
jgi:hypothetical protein